MTNPCVNDCPGRSPTCHGSCEKYAAFKVALEEKRNLLKKPEYPVTDAEKRQKARWARENKHRKQRKRHNFGD